MKPIYNGILFDLNPEKTTISKKKVSQTITEKGIHV